MSHLRIATLLLLSFISPSLAQTDKPSLPPQAAVKDAKPEINDV